MPVDISGGSSPDEFMPNGLLGMNSFDFESGLDSSKPSEELGDNSPLDQDDSFTPNGLLCVSSNPIDEVSKMTLQDDAFVPSGLLGMGSSFPTSTQDEFPNISQLLPTVNHTTFRDPVPFPRGSDISPHLVRASNYQGKAVYFNKKYRRNVAQPPAHASSQMRDLLETPIHRLLEQISADAAQRLSSNLSALASASSSSSSPAGSSNLWVDQYRPQRFIDLLGDERVHRDTLSWVKEWDFCVFGKRKAKGKALKRTWNQDENEDEDAEWRKDEYQRPKERILLLSGPPGLGKTTLAHVVAKQAGYSVFEINASDARSGQIVDDRIRPALESGSKIGSTKPSLIVIDEIDGATGAGDSSTTFIQKLVELTLDPKFKKKSRRRDGKPNKHRPLLRPIICICNDLYASSLAKLRPHARIIRFNRPADVAIVKRLRVICEEQSLRADSRALTTLVGITKGDMRGCLNTLQFIKAKNLEVTESIIRGATTGIKEADTSTVSVLNDLFTPISRKRAKDLGMSEEAENKYVHRLGRDIEASGSMDKIALGCFEHYSSLRKHDASFAAWHKAHDWLLSFDELSGAMRNNTDYSLMMYLAYLVVPFYPLFQQRGGPRVERPKADWENYMITRTNEEIYLSLSKGLRAASATRNGDYRHLASPQILQLEFAPLINRIISPPLRPVNSQVIKPEERALLSRLVSIMVSLELRFVQDKTEEGQLVYRLDPPLDVFVTYDAKRAADIAISRYATRHLVAGEIDAQLVVRHAEALDKHTTNKSMFSSNIPENEEDGHNEEAGTGEGTLMRADAAADQQPAKRQKVEVIDIADKPPTDFFGRPITSIPKKTRNSDKAKLEKKAGVDFRFNEGNSAAVRRGVKVAAFL